MPSHFASALRATAAPHELLILRDDAAAPTPAMPCVLHVDDDPDAALVLSMLLVPDAEVYHVSTAAAALQALAERPYALVVLDPALAGGDGSALLATLQAGAHAPSVLLYSAAAPQPQQQAAAYLPKPWTAPRQLWHTIATLLHLPAA